MNNIISLVPKGLSSSFGIKDIIILEDYDFKLDKELKMKIYREEIKIPYFDCDYKGEMTATAILKHLSEVSITHNDLTIDPEKLKEGNYGWMLNKWKVEMDRYPKAEETIRIETWISRAEMFFVNREFAIYDEEDKEIIRATALWIFLDMERRRPTRLKEDLIDRDSIMDESYFRDFTRFPRNMEYEDSIDFRVRRLDIDTNKHVNNVNYFIWMLEGVNDDIYDKYILKDYEIDYKQEVSYPSIVSSMTKVEKDDDRVNIYHGIYEDDGKKDNALAISSWIKK